MGIHTVSPTRNMRTTRAHLERKENGDIYAVYKLDFTKNSSRFEYCFIGAKAGQLAYNDNVISKHPKFKNVDTFEGWCRRYYAEHDMKEMTKK